MLPADPQSAALARRYVADALEDWDESTAVDVVTLLVSEVVTNAVLHAGSSVELVVRRHPRRVRVEVADESPMSPQHRTSDDVATTGRGVDLVDTLAERWGVDTGRAVGKVVWFEVSASAAVEASEARADEEQAPAGPEPEALEGFVEVQLLQAPVRLMATTQQHTETLLRELALRSLEEWTPVRLGVDFDELDQQLRAATRSGHTSADLVVHLPAGSAAGIREVADTLGRGDRLAADGLLLCPPALPEIADCRRWFLDQLVDQLEGHLPQSWEPHPANPPEGPLEVDRAEVVDHLAQAVVLADDENRITYLNAAAEALLGWDADELAGRRLTTIIPERLHHAHLAGFTRYLTTGEPRLIGTSMRVPARRRDGGEVDVELTLSAFRAASGRQMFAGVLHVGAAHAGAASDDSPSRRHRHLMARIEAVLADHASGTPEERRQQTLAALVDELGWAVAAWWNIDGAALRCVATWPQSPELNPFVAASTEQRFHAGRGLPGRVLARQAPAWIADLVADANFPRASVALAVGLRSGAAFPIIADQRVLGVVEILTRSVQPPDEGLMSCLAAIGELLGDQA